MEKFLSIDILISYITPLIKSGSTFLDSCAQFADENDIDYNVLAKLIQEDGTIFNRIKEESESLNLLKKNEKTSLLDFK